MLWMRDLLDGLNCTRAAFVAISLGGLVAFQFGAAHPERVVALAGNAPAGLCRGKHFILRHLPYFFMGEWGKRRVFEAIMGKVAPDTSPLGQQFAAFFALTASVFRPRMLNLPTLSDDEVRNLHFPVLTVLGGRDVMLHTEQTRDRLTALAPDASIDFRPDAHHYIQGTQAVILPFLREVHGL